MGYSSPLRTKKGCSNPITCILYDNKYEERHIFISNTMNRRVLGNTRRGWYFPNIFEWILAHQYYRSILSSDVFRLICKTLKHILMHLGLKFFLKFPICNGRKLDTIKVKLSECIWNTSSFCRKFSSNSSMKSIKRSPHWFSAK